ncbi:hypothetical protein IGI65_001069 [Enterococcus sp. DIV0755b]
MLNLFKSEEFKFEYDTNKNFEVPQKYKRILLRLFNLKIFDFLGLFSSYDGKSDLKYNYFSYNRFVRNVTNNYIVFLENPTALVNYSHTKMKYGIGKIRVNNFIMNKHLKKIICMSKICYSSFNEFYEEKHLEKVIQIYPLYPDLHESLQEEALYVDEKITNILFVGATFVGKGGLELCKVIEFFNSSQNEQFSFVVVTKIENIPEEFFAFLSEQKNVEIFDFNLTANELKELYVAADIFLLPTRYESFGMVFLEAMKNGCALIGPDIYAINEMIKDTKNGFLYSPKLKPWDSSGIPNEDVLKRIKKMNNKFEIDNLLVEYLIEKLIYVDKNKDHLFNMKKESLSYSLNESFGEKSIICKWKETVGELE